jgi:hypothetical protein
VPRTVVQLSGGGDPQLLARAAFTATDDEGTIGMRHLVRAVALEYGKLGRLTLASDFERFHELIRPGQSNGGASTPQRAAESS